jgi:small basic protein (TIGR04137 family)
MSIHRSLVSKSSLTRERNVLTRAERVAKLADEGRWNEGDSVFGLPKVRIRRVKAGSKQRKAEKKEGEEAAEAAEGEAEAEE